MARTSVRHPLTVLVPVALAVSACGPARAAVDSQGLNVGPALQISPATALVDAPVRITAFGLQPRELVTIVGVLRYGDSIYFVSRASFAANDRGRIDVSTQAPVQGTYSGIDPMGLFWSVKRDTVPAGVGATDIAGRFEPPGPYVMSFAMLRNGQQIAAARATRLFAAPGVRAIDVRENGLVGKLFLPASTGRSPAVIVLSGSEGGNESTQPEAALLASHGFAALALAYFKAPGLPDELFRIPVEYVKTAVDWLRQRGDIDGEHIATLGGSKGGELALLSAATFPEIHAVVAYAAPSVVGSGITRTGGTRPVSSWSLNGQEIPFLKSDSAPPASAFQQFERREPVRLRLIFEPPLRDTAAVSRYGIPVERIRGGILLITGADDQMGTTMHPRIIAERLRKNSFGYEFENYVYPDAGHQILQPYLPAGPRTEPGRFAFGGTAEGYARADADSWPRVLKFLDRMLRPTRK